MEDENKIKSWRKRNIANGFIKRIRHLITELSLWSGIAVADWMKSELKDIADSAEKRITFNKFLENADEPDKEE